MSIFANQNILMSFAHDFLKERTGSLRKDIDHCNQPPYAPFPAFLYCFSTIDLLGALYQGSMGETGKLSENSRKYMMKFMGYTKEQSELLQRLFRHKIVHSARIPVVIKYNSKLYTWKYDHLDRSTHLLIEDFHSPQTIEITPGWEVQASYRFNANIKPLADDIIESVEKSNGYLESLGSSQTLRDSFEIGLKTVLAPIG
jgi:hypothetical protein